MFINLGQRDERSRGESAQTSSTCQSETRPTDCCCGSIVSFGAHNLCRTGNPHANKLSYLAIYVINRFQEEIGCMILTLCANKNADATRSRKPQSTRR